MLKGSITKYRSIDVQALREVLKPIYDKLRDKGVSSYNLPNNEDLVDRLLGFIDEKTIDEWAEKYAEWVSKKPNCVDCE